MFSNITLLTDEIIWIFGGKNKKIDFKIIQEKKKRPKMGND